MDWIFIVFNLYYLQFLGNGHGGKLEEVGYGDEGESEEEAEGAPELCEEGGPGVEEVLLLHQDGGGGVPQEQAPTVGRWKLLGEISSLRTQPN